MQADWWMALAGGALIGLAAGALMHFEGRIAGVSGIFSGLVEPKNSEVAWRGLFVSGLVLGGVLVLLVMPSAFDDTAGRSVAMTAAGGLVVGFGARTGNGCTSGHGVCGVSRLSRRSVLATAVFVSTAALTVAVLGGVS